MTTSPTNLNQTIKNLQGFDSKNPPNPQLIDACVHCGFCLATCPSYRVIGKEMDSPRGRIYLMNGINEGEIAFTPGVTQHFDTCLGCLACVTTCPSGVRYDELIDATRNQVERNIPRSLGDRLIRGLIFNLFPYPERLSLLVPFLWLYQRLGLSWLIRKTAILAKISPRLAAMESILPRVDLATIKNNYPLVIPSQTEKRYRVGVILGCVQRIFFDDVNQATIRVLTANGCEVVIPPNQGCCSALPTHQGQQVQSQTIARQMIDSFAEFDLDAIIINAAGCGHTLKLYGHILADDPNYRHQAEAFAAKVKDVQEFLDAIGLTATLSPISDKELTIVYQDACHLLHGQKISLQPRRLLQQIPGIKLKEPLDAALCCGSAGIYNMLQPEIANELGQQKVNNLLNTGAEVIASPNPGCALQLKKHLEIQERSVPVLHPMQLLDYAITGKKITLL